MKILVQVKARAREDKVEALDGDLFRVSVKAPAIQGQANLALVRVLADYFKVSQFQVSLVSGLRSKYKVFEIELN